MSFFDIPNHIRYGLERKGALMPDDGLNEGLSGLDAFLGGLVGVTQEGIDDKRNRINSRAAEKEYRSEIERYGGTWTDGMSSGAAQRQLQGLLDDRDSKRFSRDLDASLAGTRLTLADNESGRRSTERIRSNELASSERQATQRLNATLKDNSAERLLRSELAYLTRKENRSDRDLTRSENRLDRRFRDQQASADRALQLEISMADQAHRDNVLAYQRERDAKIDKQKMIAQLMSGLGQLGGAMSIAI